MTKTKAKEKQAEVIRDLRKTIKEMSIEQKTSRAQIGFIKSIDVTASKDWSNLSIVKDESLNEENTAFAILSDVHIEERVDKSIVNNLNEYNPDIAKLRLERFFNRLMYLVRQYRRSGMIIDNLVLGLLGDIISGYIHEELMESNYMSPTEASLFAMSILVPGIKMLSEDGEFKTIKIPCAPGNHGRTSIRKKISTGYANSYEWLMYNMLAKTCEAIGLSNVEFVISKSEFVFLNVYDRICKFSHGDHFLYQGGIGGIHVPLQKWLYRSHNVMPFDMSFIGHYHQLITTKNCRVNGSVIGYNSYANALGFGFEHPACIFQLLDKKRGWTLNNPIMLNDF